MWAAEAGRLAVVEQVRKKSIPSTIKGKKRRENVANLLFQAFTGRRASWRRVGAGVQDLRLPVINALPVYLSFKNARRVAHRVEGSCTRRTSSVEVRSRLLEGS